MTPATRQGRTLREFAAIRATPPDDDGKPLEVIPPEMTGGRRVWYAWIMDAEIGGLIGGRRHARTVRWQGRWSERLWRAERLWDLEIGIRPCDPDSYSRPTGPGRLP